MSQIPLGEAPRTRVMHDEPEPALPHRLFHTLVIMSGALALSCGGLSNEQAARDQRSGRTNAGSGTGGTPSDGSSSSGASGGSAGLAAGAVTAGTGGGIHIMPVAAGGAGAVGPLPVPPLAGAGGTSSSPKCPPAQWDCRGSPRGCWGPVGPYSYYGLPGEYYGGASECVCDETRPTKPADCAGVGTFVCRYGVDAAFTEHASTVPFDCSCELDDGLHDPCAEAFGRSFDIPLTIDGGVLELCACAVIQLR